MSGGAVSFVSDSTSIHETEAIARTVLRATGGGIDGEEMKRRQLQAMPSLRQLHVGCARRIEAERCGQGTARGRTRAAAPTAFGVSAN